MIKYTEEELTEMSKSQLRDIVLDISVQKDCSPDEICPIGARKELFISSILEEQEEIVGS